MLLGGNTNIVKECASTKKLYRNCSSLVLSEGIHALIITHKNRKKEWHYNRHVLAHSALRFTTVYYEKQWICLDISNELQKKLSLLLGEHP